MTTTSRDSFAALLNGLAAGFAREPREGGRMAARALAGADVNQYRALPSPEDPSAVLAAAAALPNALPLAATVLNCRELIAWTCWEGEGLAKDLSRRLFTAELLGPDGHIPAPDLRVGLLISEAWTDYPVSNHSGEETYLVLAGVAEWVVGTSGYAAQTPGTLVHHPAWAPHGRRTREEPFLGAWRWSGDLDLGSFSVA